MRVGAEAGVSIHSWEGLQLLREGVDLTPAVAMEALELERTKVIAWREEIANLRGGECACWAGKGGACCVCACARVCVCVGK